MAAPRKYPDELRERAIRLTLDARKDPASRSGACSRIGGQLGINPETLRGWVAQAEVDTGSRPGTNTTDARRITELERENRELRRSNAILRTASAYVGDRCQAGVSSSRRRRVSYTSRRPLWPLASASSRWAWMVGRCSMVVKNMVQDSQMVS